MKRLLLTLSLGAALVLGASSFGARPIGTMGPPCYTDPNLQCLDYVDPVICVKSGEGWKTYSNACYALKDCALMRTCRPIGGGPVVNPAD
jgi:hypothetical protein